MDLLYECRDLALHDGRLVRVRPLRPIDRDLYRRAVVDLSPRSRYLRFLAPIAAPSERLLDQMTRPDGRRHVAHVAMSPDEETIVGVIRYVRLAEDPLAAELAIAIADEWQGRGLGALLVGHSAEHARLAGVRSLAATTLRENAGAARLLRTCAFEALPGAGPLAEYRARLRR